MTLYTIIINLNMMELAIDKFRSKVPPYRENGETFCSSLVWCGRKHSYSKGMENSQCSMLVQVV